MDNTFWQKQTKEKPLFPDLIWTRPENKLHAGKILIVGGNLHGFAAPAESYNFTLQAGAGQIRILLPDKLSKTVGKFLENCFFAPSNNIGSFASNALGDLLELETWANGIILAGDLGHNSETSLLFEKFVNQSQKIIAFANDSLSMFFNSPGQIFNRDNTVVILDMQNLQKFASKLNSPITFTLQMNQNQLAQALKEFSINYHACIMLQHLNSVWVAVSGHVSSTQVESTVSTTQIASSACVWFVQNPTKPFESITSSLC